MGAGAQNHIRIGTRGSPLALAQAEAVAAALQSLSGGVIRTEIVTFTTKGDQLTSERLTEAGGKGLFTREIDRAVDAGEVDIAVHSLKDVPSELPEGQEFVAFPPREDPRDALICNTVAHPRDLPEGAVVGTASLRREAQTRFLRPDVQIVTFRGNVQTRLRKLEEGQADATYLAVAGLNRLGLSHLARPLPLADFLCAPCQGIVGVVAREGALPDAARTALSQLNHMPTERCARAERAFLSRIDGSCRTAMGAILQTGQGRARLWAEWIADDGSRRVRRSGDVADNADTAALMDAGHRVADLVRAGMNG